MIYENEQLEKLRSRNLATLDKPYQLSAQSFSLLCDTCSRQFRNRSKAATWVSGSVLQYPGYITSSSTEKDYSIFHKQQNSFEYLKTQTRKRA